MSRVLVGCFLFCFLFLQMYSSSLDRCPINCSSLGHVVCCCSCGSLGCARCPCHWGPFVSPLAARLPGAPKPSGSVPSSALGPPRPSLSLSDRVPVFPALPAPEKGLAAPRAAMQPSGLPRDRGAWGFGGKLLPEPYDSFMHSHLRYYGYFQGEPCPRGRVPLSPPSCWGCSGTVPEASGGVGRRAPCPQGVPPRHRYWQHQPELPGASRAGAEL